MADLSRRRLLQASMLVSGAMLLPGVMQAAWAAGSDKPEQDTVRIGFIPLTDCAPVVIAALKGFDKKHGITIVPTKEASWAAVRDKLVAVNWTPHTFFTACCTVWNWVLRASRSRWRT